MPPAQQGSSLDPPSLDVQLDALESARKIELHLGEHGLEATVKASYQIKETGGKRTLVVNGTGFGEVPSTIQGTEQEDQYTAQTIANKYLRVREAYLAMSTSHNLMGKTRRALNFFHQILKPDTVFTGRVERLDADCVWVRNLRSTGRVRGLETMRNLESEANYTPHLWADLLKANRKVEAGQEVQYLQLKQPDSSFKYVIL